MRNEALELTVIGICVAFAALTLRSMLAGAPLTTQLIAILAAGVAIGGLQAGLRRLRIRRIESNRPPVHNTPQLHSDPTAESLEQPASADPSQPVAASAQDPDAETAATSAGDAEQR
jgi:hypothetical protein